MKRLVAAALAAATVLPAVNAEAATQVAFTINTSKLTPTRGLGLPYGITDDTSLTGTVELDPSGSGASRFVGFNFATPNQNFTLDDVSDLSSATFAPDGSFLAFDLLFGDNSDFMSEVRTNNSVLLQDSSSSAFCAGCVSTQVTEQTSAVPEPASWALMLLGFGAVGVAMRRRRETLVVTYG